MQYLVKRTLAALCTIFVAVSLNFILFRALPGDAVSGLRCQNCTEQFREALRQQYGLDQPLVVQYLIYLQRLMHGDLGMSFFDNRPVWSALAGPLANTLPLIIAGTVIAIVLGVLAGTVAAWRRGTAVDKGSLWSALSFYSMPTQWVGLLVIFYVALPLGLPVAGSQSESLGAFGDPSWWTVFTDRLQHMLLPAAVLGLGLYGQYALIVRSSMLETLGEDYILTARAKGMSNWSVVRKHGLRNAMLPVVTLMALSLGYVMAGAIVVESVFSYPGIGLATIEAIEHRDYAVLQGIFLLLTISVVTVNLLADLAYTRLDPRVRK